MKDYKVKICVLDKIIDFFASRIKMQVTKIKRFYETSIFFYYVGDPFYYNSIEYFDTINNDCL